MRKTELRAQQIAERNKKIIALHTKGMRTTDIAKGVGVSMPAVSMTLKAAGLSNCGIPKESKRSAIRKRHGEGMTNAQIAKIIGLSPSTVGQYVREMGLAPHRPVALFGAAAKGGMSFNDRIELVSRLIKKGMSREQVAAELGVKIGAVKNWYSAAQKLVSAGASGGKTPSQNVADRPTQIRGPMPAGHPIAVDAMWRGLEKYREPLAL